MMRPPKRLRLLSTALCLLPALTAQAEPPISLDEVTARLEMMGPTAKPVLSYPLTAEQLDHPAFLRALAGVAGGLSVSYNATDEQWATVRAARPALIAVNLSPFHDPRGKFHQTQPDGTRRGLSLGRTSAGNDPTKWADYYPWIYEYRKWCLTIRRQAGGIPVLLLLDYEYRTHWDQSRLVNRLNNIVYFARQLIPGVTVIWYRHGHVVRRFGGRLQWTSDDTVPEGVLNDQIWNVELFQPNASLLCRETIHEARQRHPDWRGSIWLQIGTTRTAGDFNAQRKLLTEIFRTTPDYAGFAWVDYIMLWPEPGRADWGPVLEFLAVGQE